MAGAGMGGFTDQPDLARLAGDDYFGWKERTRKKAVTAVQGFSMPDNRESWYIRFPDGSLVRATGPAMIRKQFLAGRVPPGTQVRRKSEEQWRSLADHPEFADLRNEHSLSGNGSWHDLPLNGVAHPASTVASRIDPAQMRQPGVRLLVDELLAALDSTLVYRKMLLVCMTTLPLWALFVVASLPDLLPPAVAPWQPAALLGLTVLLLLCLQAMLTRMTFTELSLMRPARIRDSYPGLGGLWFKSVLVQGTAIGLACAAAWGMRLLPAWLRSLDEAGTWEPVAAWVALAAGSLLQVVMWPALLLLAPFAAACVAEEGSLSQAVGQWRRLVRAHRWKVFVAQWLVLAFAAVVALPAELLVPLSPAGADGQGRLVARSLLAALGACLVMAYFSVANVFLYLHLRYDTR